MHKRGRERETDRQRGTEGGREREKEREGGRHFLHLFFFSQVFLT